VPGKWWVLAAGGACEVVGAAAGHGAVGKVHLSGRPQKKRAKITPLSPISSSPHIPQSGQGGRPVGQPVGQPVLAGRPAGRPAGFLEAAGPFFGVAGRVAGRPAGRTAGGNWKSGSSVRIEDQRDIWLQCIGPKTLMKMIVGNVYEPLCAPGSCRARRVRLLGGGAGSWSGAWCSASGRRTSCRLRCKTTLALPRKMFEMDVRC
jgi:hypothetical protein